MVMKYPTKNGKYVLLRNAEVEDAEAIIDVMNSVCSEKVYAPTETFIRNVEWMRNFIQEHVEEKKDALAVVAEINNRIVGTSDLIKGRYDSNRHVAELGMNILKDHREKGIGNALMMYILNWAENNKIEKITLNVFSTNIRAINLYEKYGFKTQGIKKKQYKILGNHIDEVIMEKFMSS
jgi:RimJ/RimL family protein N-acetyltransferase